RDRPTGLTPLQHAEWASLHIAFLEKSVEELLRPRLHAPVVLVQRDFAVTHSPLEDRGSREGSDYFAHGFSARRIAFGKLKIDTLIFLLVEPYDKDPFSYLRDAEVLRIEFAFEDVEASILKKSLEI